MTLRLSLVVLALVFSLLVIQKKQAGNREVLMEKNVAADDRISGDYRKENPDNALQSIKRETATFSLG